MSKCQSFLQGNIVAWKEQNLNLRNKGDNLKVENIEDMSEFFCKRRQYLLVPRHVDLATASDQCKTFGGHIATPANTEENDEVLRLVKTFPECLSKYLYIINYSYIILCSADNNNSIAWIGLERLAGRQSWSPVAATTNTDNLQQKQQEEEQFINLKQNKVDSSEDFCLTLKESGDWNTYRDCRSVTNKIEACNVCQFERTPRFSLRGACESGGPNWNYYLVQDRARLGGYYFEVEWGHFRGQGVTETLG